jgi:hypothetical protein
MSVRIGWLRGWAALALLATTAVACGSDAQSGPGSGGRGGTSGATGAAGAAGGPGGVAGTAAGGTGGSTSAAGTGGTTAGGTGGSTSAAGAGGSNAGGTTGSGGVAAGGIGGEHVVVVNGGPWPDSETTACSVGAAMAPCPAARQDYDGQDGTYRINVPTYTVTADTVTDSITGLMWQLNASTTGVGQAAAAAYCDGLSLAGHDDWRLPSRLEFVTLFDMGRGIPALPSPFPRLAAVGHWTRTPSLIMPGAYFFMNELYGIYTVSMTSNMPGARCVRGPLLSGTLQASADTVKDTMTGLEWQRSSLDDTEITWKAALAYCEALTLAAKTDWRLPNIKEIATLVDESATAVPAIDQSVFGASAARRYWSSSPAFTATTGGYASVLQIDLGVGNQWQMTDVASARCVRQAN